MWLIPTRKRPHMMAEMITAMKATGEVPACAVMHDGCQVYEVDYPKHWHIHQSDEHLEMAGALNALFKAHPGEPVYGMLDDHTRPLSPLWATKLQDAAGAWRIASAWNEKNRVNPRTGKTRLNCYCIGGELARALGWVWPDFVVHMYGDDVLEDIGYRLGILDHVKDTLFRSYLLRDGTLKPDENSRRIFRGQPYLQHDQTAYAMWRRAEFDKTVSRLRKAMPMTNEQEYWRRLVDELQDKFSLETIGMEIGVSERQVSNIKTGDRPTGFVALRLFAFHGKHRTMVPIEGITVPSFRGGTV